MIKKVIESFIQPAPGYNKWRAIKRLCAFLLSDSVIDVKKEEVDASEYGGPQGTCGK